MAKFNLLTVKSEIAKSFETWKDGATAANTGFTSFIVSAIASKVMKQDQDALRDFFVQCNGVAQFDKEIAVATRLLEFFANMKPTFNAKNEFALKFIVDKGAKKDGAYDAEKLAEHDKANSDAKAVFDKYIETMAVTVHNPAAYRKNAVEGTALIIEKEFDSVFDLVKAIDYKPKAPKAPEAPTAITKANGDAFNGVTKNLYANLDKLANVEDRDLSLFSTVSAIAWKMTAKEKHGATSEAKEASQLESNASAAVIDAMIETLERSKHAIENGITLANVGDAMPKSDNLKAWEEKSKGE